MIFFNSYNQFSKEQYKIDITKYLNSLELVALYNIVINTTDHADENFIWSEFGDIIIEGLNSLYEFYTKIDENNKAKFTESEDFLISNYVLQLEMFKYDSLYIEQEDDFDIVDKYKSEINNKIEKIKKFLI